MAENIIIIGAGHAGCQCAKELRRLGSEANITLISNEAHLPYHRPPLSKAYLKDGMAEDKLHLLDAEFYQQHHIDLKLNTWVSEVNTERQLVRLHHHDEALPYDYLVFATGTRPRQLPLPGVELKGVMSLRTVDDAEQVRAVLQNQQHVVIVGGGFIGLELAATAQALGKTVTVLEHMPRVLGRSVSPIVSDYVTALHRASGIHIEVNTFVSEIVGEEGHVVAIECGLGKIPADLVVIGVGAVANISVAEQAGITCDNGIWIDEQMRTSAPNVLAIGDCANHQNAFAGQRRIRLESVQNANDQAIVAAHTILQQEAAYHAVPWFWTDQGAARLQMTGLSFDANDYVVRGEVDTGRFSVFHYADACLVAVDSVNQPVEHMVARKLLEAGISPAKAQVADVGQNLKALLV